MKNFLPKDFRRWWRHSRWLAVGLGLLLALGLQSMVPFLLPTAAAGQIQQRSIQMSSSTPSATGVTYLATFTATSVYTIKGMVIDFCSNDPFIDNSTCSAPSGLALGSTATTSLGGTWTSGSLFSGSGLYLTNSTGVSTSTSIPVTITDTAVTNPSAVATSGSPGAGTFYARITTWTTTSGASSYNHGNTGYQDYGGLALSTATPITVTAKVMEQLSFCVYITSCGDTPAIILGHGINNTLDSTVVDTKPVSFSLSTNALNGSQVNMKGATLTSGSNTIAAAGNPSGSATPAAIAANAAGFGMVVTTPGSLTAAATYNGGAGVYGYNTTNLAGTYGDTIATSTGPVNNSVTTLTFGAQASPTTPAGIYTTTDQLIATGKF